MTQLINSVLRSASAFLWGFPLPGLIAAAGIFFTVKTRGFQFRRLKSSLGAVLHRDPDAKNGVSPFAAACTALSATVGTGNIAGVAGAIALGGPGTIFWMWITAFLGMIIKFAETLLAVKFRRKTADGFAGGPMYYIRDGLPPIFKPLAYIFAIFGVFAAVGSGNAVQINTATAAIIGVVDGLPADVLEKLRLLIGIIAAVLIATVLLGGITRISRTTETLVPAMLILYFLLAGGVIIARIERLPQALASIFIGAFSPRSITAGAVASAFFTLQKGVARSIFTNEAGMGTSAMAHASAQTKSPTHQGLFGIFEVFVDTILVCTITALAVLCSNVPIPYGTDPGAALTISAFADVYGDIAGALLSVPICFFAFTSVIGWGLYGMRCIEFLSHGRFVRVFLIVFCLSSVLGALTETETVWLISEICNSLMALPNMLALLMLSPTVIKELHPPKVKNLSTLKTY